ncbi:major facilitator superfamily domain-containing protein [Hypoxylon sp. FL1284]|nr:major facilitator superfamily domain-containing protein [Hypoxylon sp. FL1284]
MSRPNSVDQSAPGPPPETTEMRASDGSQDESREGSQSQEKGEAIKEAPSPPPGSEFPDGGRTAWLTVLGSWFCMFATYGFISSMGVFQDYYQTHFLSGTSPSNIAWILSLQVFFLSVAAPFAGWVFDNHGPNLLIIVGSFLLVFGLMMLSLSTEYYQIFLSQAVCCGIGMGLIFHGAVNSISTWFRRRRGLAVGLASSGSGVGGVVMPIMFDHLTDELGFPWTVRIIGFMILGMQIIAIFTVRSRLGRNRRTVKLVQFIQPFRDPSFVTNSIACLFGMLGMLIPFDFLKTSAEVSGLPSNLTTYILPIVNATSIIGRVFPLWAGDYLGPFNMVTIFVLYGAILALALWIPGAANTGAVIAFAALYGVPLGLFSAAIPALVARISKIEEIGYRVGTTFLINGIAGLIGNPIAGLLIGAGWTEGPQSYNGLRLFCGLAMVVAAVFFAASRVLIGGWKLNRKV